MDTKKAFRVFTLFEYEKEQEYLREMHRSGWKFVRVSGFGIYHFEKCTPEDMIYQIDYNQDGIAHKDEYVKMFGDCGWEYLQDYVGYSYFRKPASEAAGTEEIFCDSDSRFQMLERVCKGRMLPMLLLFFCVFCMLLMTRKFRGSNILALVFVVLFCLYSPILAMFALQYWKLKRRK